METIYMLVKVDAAHADTMLERVLKMDGVRFAHAVTGSYDIIISMEGPSLAKLLSRSMREINGLEGIRSTETLVAINLSTTS